MHITTTYFEGVSIRYDGENAVLGFSTKPQEARARFLLEMKQKEGPFELTETPRFNTIGPMLDVSRRRVMTVEGVKGFLDQIQRLGLNMLMLYTEDLFEVEGYPQFGHQRGRYSIAELQELDRYAAELGIELIPCIQTFGHLEKYLRTSEGKKLRDNASVLLAGAEETYSFIEAELKAIRKAFTTQRIHLGMDETFGLGLGRYLEQHGYRPAAEIYREHLTQVLEIAGKYFEQPMIWSDMLFLKDGRNYPENDAPSQEFIDSTPQVDLVFWAYSNESYSFYKHAIDQHARFKGETAFGGGVWTWNGILPNLDYTLKASKPALEACIDGEVPTVIATMWNSGGAGADYDQALPGLCVFSEYCYKGKDCTEADIYAASAHLFGVDEALFHAISDAYLGRRSASGLANAFLYGEPMLDFMMTDVDYTRAIETFTRSLAVLEANPDYKYREFCTLFFQIAAEKAAIFRDLYPAYHAGDRATLQQLADGIPALLEKYRRFYALFKKYWHRDYKPFGLENYTHDFGGAILRLEDTAETLNAYLKGERSSIGELETERLPYTHDNWRTVTSFMAFHQ